VEAIIPHFTGKFLQDPPIYSAIQKDGRRLYELARQGVSAEDIAVQPRAVEVMNIDILNFDLPKFEIQVQCGSGTYIRSLIRDFGHALDSVATTTSLQRTQQGPFTLSHTLPREDWTADKIYQAIESANSQRAENKL
jgi:tRNA pseudouridine55 synthase